MAEYISSHTGKTEEQPFSVKNEGPPRIILAEFKNGSLTKAGEKEVAFTCYRSTKENTLSFPKRILVAKSKRMYYVGSNFETQTSKVTSSVLKLLVVNKKNSTFKEYDVDFFLLKPQLESPKIKQETNDKSYMEKSSDLTLEFGTKSQQKKINSRMKYHTSTSTSDSDGISTFPEVPEMPTVAESTSSAIPPQNSSAVNVEEVYNLYDIISKEELDALISDAQVFLDVKPKTIELWKNDLTYSHFIIQFVENNVYSMNCDKAKLLCYLHYMICFLRTGYMDWKKKDPVPGVPQPFKQKLMDSFTIKKSMPQRLKDKLLAHAMVLALKLSNYVLSCNDFAFSAKVPMSRMKSVAYALGCHVLESKNDGKKIIELKLPLFKFKALPKKGKRT